MRQYVFRRLGRLVLALLGVTLITFLLLRLTGDPARVVLGQLASDEAIQQFNREHGLDRPWPEQYVAFLWKALQGDLGQSLRYEQSNFSILLERVPATLRLAGASLILTFVIGLPLGIIAALRRDTTVDYLARGLVLLAQGIPNFFLAILLILFFGVYLGWLPTGGSDSFKHLILPAFVLSFVQLPLTVRVTRSAVLDIIGQSYIRTARSKGLPERLVLVRHVLRNAALPILTILGVQVALLMSGAVVTETVFSWPGIGRLIVSAILARDFPLVQSIVFVIAMAVVVVNFLVDILYGILDPRIILN
ncbi:MAG: ABC transporter permease [Anaerolineae bacterium]|nr:ABC transporter permease [Anaerolineae bacterium]MCB0181603.1 ABC transporter permease [Anaerolineae bacterium]MCB9108312.1 ABC transporter permease [Anaerolineales bacterium]